MSTKSYLKLLAALLLIGLSSCRQKEEAPLPEQKGKRSASFRSVSLELSEMPADESASTKSIVELSAEGFKSAVLFAFPSGYSEPYWYDNGYPVAVYVTQPRFDWQLPVGCDADGEEQRMDIYTFVNPDSASLNLLQAAMRDKNLEVVTLRALQYECQSEEELLQLNRRGMPGSGIMKDIYLETEQERLTIKVKRLFARYDFSINVKNLLDKGYEVLSAGILSGKSNTRVPYLYQDGQAGVKAQDESELIRLDYTNAQDAATLTHFDENGKSTTPVTIYFPENCQGDIGPASHWSKVDQELGADVGLCSYADLVVDVEKEGRRTRLLYRLYPGRNDDMRSNFDIVRNQYRKINVNIDEIGPRSFRWERPGTEEVQAGSHVRLPFSANFIPSFVLSDGRSLSAEASWVEVPIPANAAIGDVLVVSPLYDTEQCGEDKTLIVTSGFFDTLEPAHTARLVHEWSVVPLKDYVTRYASATHPLQLDLRAGSGNPLDDSWKPTTGTDESLHCAISITGSEDVFGNGKTNYTKTHLYYDSHTGNLFVKAAIPAKGAMSRLLISVPLEDGTSAEKVLAFPAGDFACTGVCFQDRETGTERHLSPWDEKKYVSLVAGHEQYYAYAELYDPVTRERIPSFSPSLPLYNAVFRWASAGEYAFTGGSEGSGGTLCYRQAEIEAGSPVSFYLNGGSSTSSDYLWISKPAYINQSAGNYYEDYYVQIHARNRNCTQEDVYIQFRETCLNSSFDLRFEVEGARSMKIIQARPDSNDYDAMLPDEGETPAPDEFCLAPRLRQTFFLINATALPSLWSVSYRSGLSGSAYPRPQYSIRQRNDIASHCFQLDFYVPDLPGGSIPPVGFEGYDSSDETANNSNTSVYEFVFTDGVTRRSIRCRVLWFKQKLDISYASPQYATQEEAYLHFNDGHLQMAAWNPMKMGFEVNTSVSVRERIRVFDFTTLINHKDHFTENDSKVWSGIITRRDFVPEPQPGLIEGSSCSATLSGGLPTVAHALTVQAFLENAAGPAYQEVWSVNSPGLVLFQLLGTEKLYYFVHPIPVQLDVNIGLSDLYSLQPGLSIPSSCTAETFFFRKNEVPAFRYQWFGNRKYYTCNLYSHSVEHEGRYDEVLYAQYCAEGFSGDMYTQWNPVGDNYVYYCRFQRNYTISYVPEPPFAWNQWEFYDNKADYQHPDAEKPLVYRKLNYSTEGLSPWNGSSVSLKIPAT